MNKTVICVVGTRPEAIKMAPVVRALESKGIEAPILATAQHRGLLDQVLEVFGLRARWDLDAMVPGQNLSDLLSRVLVNLDRILRDVKPAAVLAQGDTTTVLAVALAAFHVGIPFGHVEAGLRSGRMDSPYPEEGNRKLAGVLAHWHFAPTLKAYHALCCEGYSKNNIHVVGNTVIDSLLEFSNRLDLPWPAGVPVPNDNVRHFLVTLHRRESFGEPMRSILGAIRDFALRHPDACVVYPVHPNPSVQGEANRILCGLKNVFLVEPLDYATLVHVMKASYAIFTDSGGLQEEGPALGKPLLVFRDVTERPEVVEAGGACLVGADPCRFAVMAEQLWDGGELYKKMAVQRFLYGDGSASLRIAEILQSTIGARG